MNESEDKAYQNYNPVTVTVSESVGILFLGVLSLILLVTLLRSQARQRKLLVQLAGRQEANREEKHL